MFSVFSFFVAVLWLNICFYSYLYLRRQTVFLVKFSTPILFLILILGIIRVVLPLDFSFTAVIQSYKILPLGTKALSSSRKWAGKPHCINAWNQALQNNNDFWYQHSKSDRHFYSAYLPSWAWVIRWKACIYLIAWISAL